MAIVLFPRGLRDEVGISHVDMLPGSHLETRGSLEQGVALGLETIILEMKEHDAKSCVPAQVLTAM